MAVSALQSEAEWLSDILAALGFSGGGVPPGGAQKVQGMAADGALASGNPVLMGLTDNTNAVSLRSASAVDNVAIATSGPRILAVANLIQGATAYVVNAAAQGLGGDANSGARVQATHDTLFNGTNYDRTRSANGASGTTGTGLLGAGGLLYDETLWQSSRGNTDATVLTSASRTTTQTVTFTNYNSTFLRVVLDMTTVGTGSVTVSIDAQDAISGKWINLLTGVAITTNSVNAYSVGPGLPDTTNVSANKMLSRNMRVVVTANNANAATYSVGRQLTGM